MNKLLDKIVRYFGRKKKKDAYADGNPWIGLMSYQDKAYSNDNYRFCGRDREIADFFYLVDNHTVTTLYGKSGIGKTSLLNAGVFPQLRAHNYHPVSIRLGLVEGDDYVGAVADLVAASVTAAYGDAAVVCRNINTVSAKTEYSRLWSFFASHRFYNDRGEVIFPVVVFDQFEEVLRKNTASALALLQELSYISDPRNAIEDCVIDGEPYSYDYNFRFILSLREDDLYRLEDIVDRNYIPNIKDNRYRLRNLTEEGAREIIGGIGCDIIDSNDKEAVIRFVTDAARNTDDRLISTNMLSLLCAMMYRRYVDTNAKTITATLVEEFISGNPFEKYYTEAVSGLSEGEKRFIEDRLIDADGRRNSMSESEFIGVVRDSDRLINGNTRILQRVSAANGSKTTNVELLHDALCSTILKNRTIRLERTTRTITSLYLFIVGVICLYCLHTAIVDKFVEFFLACSSGKAVTIDQVEAVALMVAMLFFPPLIAVLTYRRRLSPWLAAVPLLIIVIPSSFIINNTNLNDSIIAMTPIGIATVLLAAVSLVLFLVAFIRIKERWVIDRMLAADALRGSLAMPSVLMFYTLLAIYLFFMSVFNTGSFTIERGDSAWAIVVVPLLALCWSISISESGYNKLPAAMYLIYLMVVCLLCVAGYSGMPLVYICFVVSLILVWFIFAGKNKFQIFATLPPLWRKLIVILGNVELLIAVLVIGSGYEPCKINDSDVERVYPWKIAVVRNGNMYGTVAAMSGDTIIQAQFDSIKGNYLLREVDKPAVDSEVLRTAYMTWFLNEHDGHTNLICGISPNFEYDISSLASDKDLKNIKDSIASDASRYFIDLRNATIRYIVEDNDSALRYIPHQFDRFSNLLQKDLDISLDSLDLSLESEYFAGGGITESEVSNIIRSLTRCMYLNMMTEAIYKSKYQEVCEWFLCYYIPVMLTDWMNTGYKTIYSLSTGSMLNANEKSFSEPTTTINFSSCDLAENRAYAWYSMFYTLFSLEYNSETDTYSRYIQSNNSLLNEYARQDSVVFKNLSLIKDNLDAFDAGMSEAERNSMRESAANFGKMSGEQQEEFINMLLSAYNRCADMSRYMKSVSPELSEMSHNIEKFAGEINEIALNKLDRNFERMIKSTYAKLIKIIENNPNCIYNGLFTTLCERLYSIGAVRRYDMTEYSAEMKRIDAHRVSGIYKFMEYTDSLVRVQNKLIEDVKIQKETQVDLLQQILQGK